MITLIVLVAGKMKRVEWIRSIFGTLCIDALVIVSCL